MSGEGGEWERGEYYKTSIPRSNTNSSLGRAEQVFRKNDFFYFYTFNPLLPLIHGGARSYGAKQIPFIMFIIKQRFLSAFILESKEFITSVSYLQIYFLQQRIF